MPISKLSLGKCFLFIVKTIRNKYIEWVKAELLNGTECGIYRYQAA